MTLKPSCDKREAVPYISEPERLNWRERTNTKPWVGMELYLVNKGVNLCFGDIRTALSSHQNGCNL